MPSTVTPSPSTAPSPREPLAEEVGLLEARTLLGQLATAAHSEDQVTYLTRHGRRVAAVVSADSARSLQHLPTDSAGSTEDGRLREQAAALALAAQQLVDVLEDSRVPHDLRRRVRHVQATANRWIQQQPAPR